MQKQEDKKTDVLPDSLNGYSLFTDVENEELQARNRGVVLGNITMDHPSPHKKGKITAEGTLRVLEYFGAIPMNQRKMAMDYFQMHLAAEGFIVRVS